MIFFPNWKPWNIAEKRRYRYYWDFNTVKVTMWKHVGWMANKWKSISPVKWTDLEKFSRLMLSRWWIKFNGWCVRWSCLAWRFLPGFINTTSNRSMSLEILNELMVGTFRTVEDKNLAAWFGNVHFAVSCHNTNNFCKYPAIPNADCKMYFHHSANLTSPRWTHE